MLAPTPEPVEQQEAPKQELSDERKVMQEYNNQLNNFIYKVTNYPGSKSALQRVLTSLAVSPLNKEEFHFSYPEEKELFDLGTKVNSTKFVLMLFGLEQQKKISWNIEGPKQENGEMTNEEQVSPQQ